MVQVQAHENAHEKFVSFHHQTGLLNEFSFLQNDAKSLPQFDIGAQKGSKKKSHHCEDPSMFTQSS